MTPKDFALLCQAFRAAHARGWRRDHVGPCGRESGARYWVDNHDSTISLSRDGYLETPISGTDCHDVEMAVDHLAGVKVLPVELHSAYRAGAAAVTARRNRLDRQTITLLSHASDQCQYHGQNWDFLGRELMTGLPRCDSCKQPYRVAYLAAALRGEVQP